MISTQKSDKKNRPFCPRGVAGATHFLQTSGLRPAPSPKKRKKGTDPFFRKRKKGTVPFF